MEFEINTVTIDEVDSILELNLRVGGQYEDIYRYVLLLENLPYSIVINDLRLLSTGVQEFANVPEGVEAPTRAPWEADLKFSVISYLNSLDQ